MDTSAGGTVPIRVLAQGDAMTTADLDRAIRHTGADPHSATMRACRRVLIDGVPVYAAGREVGVSHPAIYRGLGKLRAALELTVCELCGQSIPPATIPDER